MDPTERRRKFQAILDRYDEAAKELTETREHCRASTAHFDATVAHMAATSAHIAATNRYVQMIAEEIRATHARNQDINEATDKAVRAMLAANRDIQALFNDEGTS